MASVCRGQAGFPAECLLAYSWNSQIVSALCLTNGASRNTFSWTQSAELATQSKSLLHRCCVFPGHQYVLITLECRFQGPALLLGSSVCSVPADGGPELVDLCYHPKLMRNVFAAV